MINGMDLKCRIIHQLSKSFKISFLTKMKGKERYAGLSDKDFPAAVITCISIS